MSEPQPSTSARGDIPPGLIQELLDDFATELKAEEAANAKLLNTKRKIDNLKYKPLKDDFYKVFRRMEDTQRKPYILMEIKDFLRSEATRWLTQNVKLFGVYTYDCNSSNHYLLTCDSISGMARTQVCLQMYRVDEFPVVDSYVEIFGDVKTVKDIHEVVVHFFHEIREDCAQEYSELLKRQIAMHSKDFFFHVE